jgi:hypothetical protein
MERLRDNPIPAALCGIGLTWLATSESGRSRASISTGSWEESGDGRDDSSALSEATRHIGDKAQEYAFETTTAVRRSTRRAQTQLQRMMHDNPLMVGAGALVVGAALGLSLPETERENEWMGETRDNLVNRAQDVARNAASTAQEATGEMAGEVVKRVMSGEQG